jgi:hypothetical protein
VPAKRGILSPIQTNRPRQQPFQSVPKIHAIQDWIHHVGDRAIMAVLGIRVVTRMVLRVLQQLDVLQKGNDGAIFFARAVRPFVKLIGIRAQNGKHPDFPRQQPGKPRRHHQHPREHH